MKPTELIVKIQALPETQRKTIFIIIMTFFSLIAIFLVMEFTNKDLSRVSSQVNLPNFSPKTSLQEPFSQPTNDFMSGDSDVMNNVNMPAQNESGFDPNQVFNFNQ